MTQLLLHRRRLLSQSSSVEIMGKPDNVPNRIARLVKFEVEEPILQEPSVGPMIRAWDQFNHVHCHSRLRYGLDLAYWRVRASYHLNP